MKIDITKEEYRLLLDILSISDWVMNSYKLEDDSETEPYVALEQKLLSHAKDFGFDNLVQYDAEEKEYFPTAEYEAAETDARFIDEFEDFCFWEQLCSRLAERDLIRERGAEVVQEMSPWDRITEAEDLMEKYEDEFAENGIENLVISEG
ncbi:hypothetical protein [Desulfosudis oleivorans]|uniref:Uncharacterized protein n=1 Tax=Desulfosudis oleivorans (strain DSM 6200 / JCM 39069 / Hxd3) TaxID=96561 RepID=A8ZWN9_DESOH|nr:hypothetical protein [Desulfosudis oleivorans]ABW68370.1 conserved hypothetical protein [Desulfosudis oleivorans Hxd3]